MNFTFIMDKLTTTLVLMVIETVGSRSAAARITLLMVPSCVALEKKNTRGETSTSLLVTSNRSSIIWRFFLDFLSTKTETYWSKKMRSRKAIVEAFTVGQLTPLSSQQ